MLKQIPIFAIPTGWETVTLPVIGLKIQKVQRNKLSCVKVIYLRERELSETFKKM